jgi:hypothetical protein
VHVVDRNTPADGGGHRLEVSLSSQAPSETPWLAKFVHSATEPRRSGRSGLR